MSDSAEYDVAIIGGGPGGYVAAIRAAQLGLSVALIEEKNLGGICLNWGCIPTKALLKGAEFAHSLGKASTLGFELSEWKFDLPRLVKHSRDVSSRLTDGIEFLMHKNGITVYTARAKLVAKEQLELCSTESDPIHLKATHIIIATGASPRMIPGVEPDGDRIWTYFEAVMPKRLPKSLLVIGSGAIGIEFASFYNDLGVDVTVVEALDQLLPNEDADVSAFVTRSMQKRGVKFLPSTRTERALATVDGVECHLVRDDGAVETSSYDRVLLAAGVTANSGDLGLGTVGVEIDGAGFILTDSRCQTNVVGVYAIGDVSGPPCLAHKASHEAVLCVEQLAVIPNVSSTDKNRIPACTYCRPQIASLGLTERQARALGKELRIGRFDLQANGKALASGDTEGFVKVIFDDESGELLGAHMVGAEATEQLQGFGIAQSLEGTADDLVDVIFAHPTLSEAMHEAVLDAYGHALHA